MTLEKELLGLMATGLIGLTDVLDKQHNFSPELLSGYGLAIIAIMGGLVKIYFEVRSGNKETRKVHVLVNARMTVAITTIARLSRSVAKLTKDPEDVKIAEEAERALETKQIEDEKIAGVVS